jgi:hypothetical protein
MSTPAAMEAAMSRWKTGHQAFHVYLVAMNTMMADADRALQAGRTGPLAECLHRLAVLYDAATATMQLAADFPVEDYANAVRPSMAPPSVEAGFSGMLNSEHRLMTRALRNLHRSLAARWGTATAGWPAEVRRAWDQVDAAKVENIRRHELICEMFVPEGPSLLREYLDHQRSTGES